ncbi:MAG: folylpolyglutamate synthase/dihydrofolate synthase family protein [Granulosicoccus sp.]
MTALSTSYPGPEKPLEQWLAWLETVHPVNIDMGLDRVSSVADRLQLRPSCMPLILVAGTNGKGSTVNMLSAIYAAAGFRVGAYTSPHVSDFCERICINGEMADEKEVVDALLFVEQGRQPETLTYFEYTTLAAMRIFLQKQCDVVVLEVGLGGRLDATNLWDADCAVVTSIALDHQEYLGSDVGVIATEKAAIGRRGKPLIIGQANPPDTLLPFAERNGFEVVDIGALPEAELPEPAMNGVHQRRNAGCAVAAVNSLQSTLPVEESSIHMGLQNAVVPARFEQARVDGVSVIMDVAHNPAGACALRETWEQEYPNAQCELIFASLADKDIKGLVVELSPLVASWHCIELESTRAASVAHLKNVILEHTPSSTVLTYDSPDDAWRCARKRGISQQRPVLVAGSFYTIGLIRQVWQAMENSGRVSIEATGNEC